MSVGNTVRLMAIPPQRSHWDLKTRTLFENCLGGTFRIARVERSKRSPHPLIVGLEVGHVLGKSPEHEIIFVPAAYVRFE
jgi:hypothetical protein